MFGRGGISEYGVSPERKGGEKEILTNEASSLNGESKEDVPHINFARRSRFAVSPFISIDHGIDQSQASSPSPR